MTEMFGRLGPARPKEKKLEAARCCVLASKDTTSSANQRFLMGNRVLPKSRRESSETPHFQISRVNAGVRVQGLSRSTMRWIVDARRGWVIAAWWWTGSLWGLHWDGSQSTETLVLELIWIDYLSGFKWSFLIHYTQWKRNYDK